MRIRQELKLDFYKEYKHIYVKLIEKVSKLESKFNKIKRITSGDSSSSFYEVEEIKEGSRNVISYKQQQVLLNDFFKFIDILSDEFENLDNLLKNNNEITENFKKKISLEEIKVINNLKIQKENLEDTYDYFEQFNTADPVTLLLLKPSKIKMIQQNKKAFSKILEQQYYISFIIDSLVNRNYIIQNECIKKYFKLKKHKERKYKNGEIMMRWAENRRFDILINETIDSYIKARESKLKKDKTKKRMDFLFIRLLNKLIDLKYKDDNCKKYVLKKSIEKSIDEKSKCAL